MSRTFATTMQVILFATAASAVAAVLALCMSAWAYGDGGIAAAATGGASGALAAQSTSSTDSATKAASKPTDAQLKAFKKASADFSLELFGRCVAAKGGNANVTIAPMSVMNALAVAANGARGKTRAQMRNVLGDGASMACINKNLSWYNGKLANVKKARLRNANSLWYDNSGKLKMKKRFLRVAKRAYGAEVAAADFSSAHASDKVNAWVAEKTNGMIKKIVDRLQPDDRAVIVNALYFDAEWLSPYTSSDVQPHAFTDAKGAKHEVDMMYGTEHSYIEGTVGGKAVTGFMKPYAKGYQYVALLPEKGVSLKKLVKSLDGDAFRKLVGSATAAAVQTGLPKYSLSYGNDRMEAQLRAMGIDRAFTQAADFTNMGTDPQGGLYLGNVMHKTKVELDEQGTKAAASTAVVARASAAFVDAKTVILDRPFVYAIVDNATKLPVFVGAVNDLSR